jgi:hypothetical protein
MSDAPSPWCLEITADLIRRLSMIPPIEAGPSLPSLPTELHLQIFAHLDKIDATCLGLTCKHLYGIFHEIHGKVPLNTRRIGPNALESAWEVVGKQECEKCSVYRCKLHKHIAEWMPEDLEYCHVKRVFGRCAEEGARNTCWCGRHPSKKMLGEARESKL